jgi:glycosyltransferase involved in cell wall biosynthesis
MATNARAERLLGVDARSIVQHTYFITDAFDFNLSRIARVPLLGRLVPLFLMIWAAVYADRLHFYCDRGFLPSRALFTFDFRELRVYRLLHIPVMLWTYGADVRSRGACVRLGEPNCCTECDAPGRYCICDDTKHARNVQQLGALSTAVFSGVGDMFKFVPGSIDDLFYWPVDLDANDGERYRPYYPQVDSNRPLRIVHATNHRLFKGTRYLIEAVNALRSEGVPIELVLVEQIPNAAALELYRSADVIFDNCLMGSFGYLGLEGMALGKPVMCFIRDRAAYLLHPEECPVIGTHIMSMKNDLRSLVEQRDLLPELGRRGRAYVERHFSMQAFADRLANAYQRLGLQQ